MATPNEQFDDADLRALQNQANAGPSAATSPEEAAFLNQPLNIDFEGHEFQGTHPEGKYPCRLMKINPKVSQTRTDVMSGETKGGNRYIAVDWLILAGPRKGFHIFDTVMLEGKGLQRFQLLVSELGMYNKQAKRFTGRLADLLNQMAWVKIIHSEEEYPVGSGKKQIRDRVAFDGYEAITKYPIPGDIPANGAAQAAAATPPEPPKEEAPPTLPSPGPTVTEAAPAQSQPAPEAPAASPAASAAPAAAQQPVTVGAGGQQAMPPW